ncbi:MAG: molybdopterin cofactor-binding domain-containing protein, partial [Pseudomonadota bacterium]|nr:molybdopterin cofactor-binding domain-containing protein [Pseudomonadota bacterium]
MPNSTMDDIEFEKFAVGQPVSRLEDPMLLRGDGIYTDDINLDGQAYAYVLRSPFAHGHIRKLDVSAAGAANGVLCVLTAKELAEAGVSPLFCRNNLESRDGTPIIKPARPCLATDKVLFRGEAIAVIVAENLAQAKDAAELVELDVDVLPAVTDARASLEDGAPQLHDIAPNNRALDWELGDPDEAERIIADAYHVTRLKLRNNRVAISPIEPRAAVGEYDVTADRFTLHVPTQGVFGFTSELSEHILGIPRDKLRIKTNRVGGSFGMK